ncbi:uncharacterized protein PAC_06365 [Phialocephala subalpina]|uniref:Uncharacterized protein n=1 Tax=Phialocephala subalpina TaxID=576137 RepID=A0A1L7WUM9_9HELO|nr:uncharacterized protein PAC_06365 [Phialocephala subalpina]
MDDPWGSPWADEVQLPQPIKSEDKPDFEIRPTTPARVATLSLQEKTNSPWDDAEDDGFGEWATLPAESGRSLGFDGQNDAWNGSASAPAVAPKTDSTALSPVWNDSQDIQVDGDNKLAPSPFLKSTDLARQPSPDPWATAFTFNDDTPQSTQEQGEKKDEPHAPSTEEEESEHNISAADVIPPPSNDKLLPDGQNTDEQEAIISHGTIDGMESEESNIAAGPEVAHVTEAAPAVESLDGDPSSSRPSSSPSEHSQHDELAQESPRTSFDEEPKRPQVPRKVSSKVQELVEHFDGLAKQDVSDSVGSSSSSGQDTIKAGDGVVDEEEVEEDDDFGDFEEGQSDDEQEAVEAEIPPPAPRDQTSKELADHKEPISTKPTPKKFVGPVDFDIDMSALEKIYPDLEADAPFEKVFIMDTLPYDSFATTEERKAWYRVSRYGTMRKHNTGDDNYIRINWPHSEIRKDTLKIVARWMEEDRISGRVVLGGGSKGSSIFGWGDKKAIPMPLSHALAAKAAKQKVEAPAEKVPDIPREWPQDLARKLSTSKRSPSRTRRRSSIKPTESPQQTKSAIETPVANFGWNAAPQKAQSLDNHPLPGHKTTASMSKLPAQLLKQASPLRRSASVQRSSSNSSTATFNAVPSQTPSSTRPFAQPISNVPQAKATLSSLAISDFANDDDDDWGEMVASPITTPTPPLPFSGQFSQTTSNMPTPFSKTPVSAVTTPPVTSHRSTPSFDDILAPQPASFKSMEQPAVPSSISGFGATPSPGIPISSASPIVHSATAAVDPWAMADFSVFESAPAPPPKPDARFAPKIVSKPVTKSVTFSPSPLAPPRSNGKSREEIELDKIVQSVVKSLPDLSYMLRR